MLTNPAILNRVPNSDIAGIARDLKIPNLTFVAGSKKTVDMCRELSKTFHSNYACIRKEGGRFGADLVLYGKINPTAILVINKNFSTMQLLEDLDLVKCAGAKKVYVKRLQN